MSLASAVKSCSKKYVVKRHLSVGVLHGRKADPRTENVKVDAAITPITGRDLQRLGGGHRVEGTLLILSIQELFTSDSSVCSIADTIIWKGVDYQIKTVLDWDDQGGFWECVGTRSKP